MNQNRLTTIGENLLPALAYGDSAGLPAEKKTAAQINELYGRIDHLVDIQDNPYFEDAEAGTTSDDTEFSRIAAESLIRTERVEIHDIAKRSVVAGQGLRAGWGGSTRKAIDRLGKSVPWNESGEPEGKGNGVVMKLAPLSYRFARDWHRGQQLDIERVIESYTRMTHDNDLSVVASVLHDKVCLELMNDQIDPEEVPEFAAFTAHGLERRYRGAATIISDWLGRLASLKTIEPDAIIDLCPDGGFYVPETLVMAYGSFAVSSKFPESTFAAVNLGGDADSVASIVSAMSVMKYPDVEWPADLDKVQDIEELRRLSHDLATIWVRDGRYGPERARLG